MTNTEKNVAIAKFMSIDVHVLSFKSVPEHREVIVGKEEDFDWDSDWKTYTNFNPDTDWNWLHRAFVKFRELPIPEGDSAYFSYHKREIVNGFEYDTISEAFEALYEGIFWFNNLNK